MTLRGALCVCLALAGAVPLAAVAAEDALWRGNFLLGTTGALFSPCRSGERLRLEDATPGGALEAAYRALARRPGRAIFAEFFGQRAGETIRATRFARAQAEGPGCREDLGEIRLRAYGFNPFVQLEMRAARVYLRLSPSGEPREYPGAALRVEDGEARYEGADAGSVLRLRVRAEPCRETLSSAIFSHAALIEVDGERYAVCAYWGDLGPPPALAR
ncbi:MAG: hypothetical protein R3357_16300 [Burkholderiales bacterium]|nr:hypothetical protein [Burkholderiales bacterium]